MSRGQKGATFNRSNRRSGGAKKARIVVGSARPYLTIQCFERRCGECPGLGPVLLTLSMEDCSCPCHQKRAGK